MGVAGLAASMSLKVVAAAVACDRVAVATGWRAGGDDAGGGLAEAGASGIACSVGVDVSTEAIGNIAGDDGAAAFWDDRPAGNGLSAAPAAVVSGGIAWVLPGPAGGAAGSPLPTIRGADWAAARPPAGSLRRGSGGCPPELTGTPARWGLAALSASGAATAGPLIPMPNASAAVVAFAAPAGAADASLR
jgi:hypothetical protein